MDAYVHVQKAGSRVAVGVVFRDGYTTLSSAGWLHEDEDVWQALRDTIEGLLEKGQTMTIHTALQGAELAVNGQYRYSGHWKPVREALDRTGSRLTWTPADSATGMVDARAKAWLMLGFERRGGGTMSWRRNGRCR